MIRQDFTERARFPFSTVQHFDDQQECHQQNQCTFGEDRSGGGDEKNSDFAKPFRREDILDRQARGLNAVSTQEDRYLFVEASQTLPVDRKPYC